MSKQSRRTTRQARKTSAGHRLNKQEKKDLKEKRAKNHSILHEEKNNTGTKIIPRTAASNKKSSATTVIEQKIIYEDIVSAQIEAWRLILPGIIKRLSKINDLRRPKSIKHSIAVLLFFGLLLFLFRIKSKRDFNAQMTGPGMFEFFHKLFPEINSIPHADTITRILKTVNTESIEQVHINMIKSLIKKKKFRKLLLSGKLPISIDGTQKMTRDDQLQEEGWQLRIIHKKEGDKCQQYVYVLEANITFANGLNIPLLTEYCYLEPEDYLDINSKQDCELKAFYRLSNKIKKYFKRSKIIVLLDNLYACQNVINFLQRKKWDFMIKLPAKLKTLGSQLQDSNISPVEIPNQAYYRERHQKFIWINDVDYKGNKIHIIRCYETWKEVSRTTGNIITKRSEHTWISCCEFNIENLHERCNLAARTRAFIEDNFNTEKNRGYQYKHAFCYDWNAMKNFHLLMRLAHAINILSEFTKRLKKYIRSLGVLNTCKNIFETIKHCWISVKFMDEELKKTPQLKFDFSQ